MRPTSEYNPTPVTPERRAELDRISKAVEAELPDIMARGKASGVPFREWVAYQKLMRELRTLREGKGLSLDAAAEAVGMDKAQLSRLETGQGNPTLATVEKVANGYGYAVRFALEPVAAGK